MPEIDDNQYAQFANLDAFVRRGLSNPRTRRKMLEIQKTLNPDTAIPEIDEADPLHHRINELETKISKQQEVFEEKEREREERQHLAQLTSKWTVGQSAAKKAGYSEEGLTNLEKFMEEHGIASHEAAIPYYEKVHPKPSPAISSGNRWDFFGPQPDDSLELKPLFDGHEDQWLNTAVADTLNKVRNG